MSQQKILTEHVAVNLTKMEAVALRAAATRDGRSVSSMIRKMVMDAIHVHKRGR